MANTFKFGNENWAVKDGKVLAYNDENNAFKPLPFTFARSSSATRVDNEGLIKTTDSGFARIDFLNNTSGHLLLEPSSTNLFDYSEDFSQWENIRTTDALSSINSPSGSANVYKIIPTTDNNTHRIDKVVTLTDSNTYSLSFFAKKGEYNCIRAAIGKTSVTGNIVSFNLDTGVKTETGTIASSSMVEFSNGWFRCSFTAAASTADRVVIGLGNDDTYSFAGDGSSGIFLWGAMIEEKAFSTSYISTTGSTVTRAAETCDSAGNSTVFGDSEGVLYAEMAKNNGTQYSLVSLQKPSITNTYAYIGFLNNTTQIKAEVKVAGTAAFSKTRTFSDTSQYFKIALKYKSGDYALYINGHKTDTGTSTTIFSDGDLQELEFGNHNNSTFRYYGKIKNVQVYNTALTDAELIELTS